MLAGPKKFLDLTPTPKIAPKGPRGHKRSYMGQIWNKKIGIYFQNQKWLAYISRSQKISDPDPNPKKALKSPKRAKKPTKGGALLSTFVGLKKFLEANPNPKKGPKNPKMAKRFKIKNKRIGLYSPN